MYRQGHKPEHIWVQPRPETFQIQQKTQYCELSNIYINKSNIQNVVFETNSGVQAL